MSRGLINNPSLGTFQGGGGVLAPCRLFTEGLRQQPLHGGNRDAPPVPGAVEGCPARSDVRVMATPRGLTGAIAPIIGTKGEFPEESFAPYILNLNFDDVHPETSNDIADCGGDMEKGVFKYILSLLDEFPKLKITLFVVPNWIDKPNDPFLFKHIKKLLGLRYTNQWYGEPFRLDKHEDWCEWLNSFVEKGKIEICVHGLYHHRDSDPHSAEFKDLSYEECKRRILLAEKIFKNAGLKYSKIFRPPGWGISEGLFKALKDLKYSISLDPIACGISINKLPRYSVSIYKNLINIPQNWDIKKGKIEEAIKILEKYKFLSAKGHIQDRYGRDVVGNGLTKESYKNIRNLLIKIEERGLKVRYCMMKEIVEFVLKSKIFC